MPVIPLLISLTYDSIILNIVITVFCFLGIYMYVNNNIFYSRKGIWKATCSAITAGEMCGEESGNAVLNIQTNTDYSVTMFCSEAEISLIPEFMQEYMQAESRDASVGNESVE